MFRLQRVSSPLICHCKLTRRLHNGTTSRKYLTRTLLTSKKFLKVSNGAVSSSEIHRHQNTDSTTVSLPKETKVVIGGGGVIGCSIAYHLAKAGWTDVVLLEQGSLTCGTTWHAAGIVGTLRGTSAEINITNYSSKLYKELEDEGLGTGWKQCGSLSLCRTEDRLISYKRAILNAQRYGVEAKVLTPEEIKDLMPLLEVEDLKGGIWIPGDGVVGPNDVAMAMAKKAKDMGVTIIERCQIQQVLTEREKVSGVETDLGDIRCQYFVNCAGQWARDLGQRSDPPVRVPLHSCEHYYLVTKPMEGINAMMPVVRDYDGFIYLREWGGGILSGGFEPVAKPVFHEGIPDKFEFQLLPEDWDHFQVLLEQMLHRVPSLQDAEVRQLTNGPESFTPDGKYIMGRCPEVKNYFVAAGMNSSGVAAAGGIGKYMSEWIIKEDPSIDMWALDVRRFVDLHNNKKFLRDRVKETLGSKCRLKNDDFSTSRDLRTSPIYPRLKTHKGVFNQFMGYERPVYFDRFQSARAYESLAGWDKELEMGRRLGVSPLYPRLAVRNAVFTQSARGFERVNYFDTPSALENLGLHNTATPYVDYKTGRNVRMFSLHPRYAAQGAVFHEFMGCEATFWFDTKYSALKEPDEFQETEIVPKNGTFGKPPWFDKVKSEYWACREGVGLIDMSTFTKFDLRSAGREVVDFLQYVCSNDVDKSVGTIIHTGMQNHQGGYENDCSVIRLAENWYFMIGPTAQQTRSYSWIKDHLPTDGSVVLSDVTSMYTAINVIGPKAQELLSELTDTPLGKQDFTHMTCKEINVGQASGIKAMRLTHSGEDGWILYIPSEYALHVYDSLMSYGKNYGIRNAGYYALRALRTEKFFAYWGTDLTPQNTPLECGREYRVKLDKGGFIGYPALVAQRQHGIKKKLVQFLIEEHDLENDIWPWGGEPIYRNGKYCGMTTSTAYGFTVDRHVCLGYVENIDESTGQRNYITTDFILKNAKYEIDIAGKRFPAKAGIYPPTLAPAGIIINSGKQQHQPVIKV